MIVGCALLARLEDGEPGAQVRGADGLVVDHPEDFAPQPLFAEPEPQGLRILEGIEDADGFDRRRSDVFGGRFAH